MGAHSLPVKRPKECMSILLSEAIHLGVATETGTRCHNRRCLTNRFEHFEAICAPEFKRERERERERGNAAYSAYKTAFDEALRAANGNNQARSPKKVKALASIPY